jgi:hypothetical protein
MVLGFPLCNNTLIKNAVRKAVKVTEYYPSRCAHHLNVVKRRLRPHRVCVALGFSRAPRKNWPKAEVCNTMEG